MSNLTPGEWIVDTKKLEPRIMGTHAATGETFVIAKVITYIGAEDESRANALLFAASKAMLNALKQVWERRSSVSEKGYGYVVFIDRDLCNAIEEALTLAEPQAEQAIVITAGMFGLSFDCPMCQTVTLHRASPHYKVICKTCGDEHDAIPF